MTRPRSRARAGWAAALLLAACAGPRGAELDARGIYFHAWTGSSAGTEWALVHRVDTDAYRLTDVLGNGFRFAVGPDGTLAVLDEGQGGSGRGAFLGRDEARFDWRNWGLHFSSRIWRAPRTESSFPILIGARAAGDAELAGTWLAEVRELSPTTGSVLRTESTTVRVVVDGEVLRLEWPDGSFDQGVFVAAREAVFRVLAQAPAGPYATPAGCATSRDQDVLGVARFEGEALALDLLLQTRAKVGLQIQSQLHCELRRAHSGPGGGNLAGSP